MIKNDTGFWRPVFWVGVTALMLLLLFASGALAADETVSGGETEKEPLAAAFLPRAETNQILTRIRSLYRRPEVYKGNFTQVTRFADSQDQVLSSGRLWLQGPDKMRWEYLLPEPQLLTSDGEMIWYHNPDLNQVMTGKVKDIKEARVIVNLLSEIREAADNYQIRISRGVSVLTLKLLPVKGSGSPSFESLELLFKPDDLRLRQSRMTDLFGNLIEITYNWSSGPDPSLPQTYFVFTPPAGCDIVPLN